MKLFYQKLTKAITALSIVLAASSTNSFGQQAVSGIVTDYSSYWKSSASSVNAVKPANSHNLLAFTFNGKQYSTGVNDGALTSHGESFTSGDFWSLPVDGLSNSVNGNTKVGLGEMYDGIHNGGSATPPENDISLYLTDGIKGLNIGTCIANLPSGTLSFLISNIKPSNIGDGIPDILVTQVADPSGSNDRYSFTDNSGNVIGQVKEIIFNNITPVGNWTADFYEATKRPMTLAGGYTNTDRPIRVWAADLSDFGITAANYQSVQKFKILLNGNSDVAFVAYNNKSFNISSQILPVTLTDFSAKASNGNAVLNWKTATEKNSKTFIIEKSTDNVNYVAIDSVNAHGNTTEAQYYSAIDKNLKSATNYYRLRMIDIDGKFDYSKTVQLQTSITALTISVYPNPATDKIVVNYPSKGQRLQVFDSRGSLIRDLNVSANSMQSTIDVSTFSKGIYHLVFQGSTEKLSQSFLVR